MKTIGGEEEEEEESFRLIELYNRSNCYLTGELNQRRKRINNWNLEERLIPLFKFQIKEEEEKNKRRRRRREKESESESESQRVNVLSR